MAEFIVSSPEQMYSDLNAVIGRPYSFLENSDPKGRTFTRHMLPSAPLVMIRPGRVKFSEKTTDFIAEALSKFGRNGVDKDNVGELLRGNSETGKGGSLFNNEYGVSDEDKAAIQAAIDEKQKGTVRDFTAGNDKSIRYFEFASDASIMREYQSVLHTISSKLYSRMNDKSVAWADVSGKWNPLEMTNGGFYTFWADNASSVSESASSEVGATKLAGLVKGISDISREAQFFLGENYAANRDSVQRKGQDALDQAINGVSEFIGGGNATGLRASLGDAILGMNPMFPEVWKDSSFSRSYNISFKFHSPYGSPSAVYQNVLLPFSMLLSLVMPVMTNPGVYSEPFIFQLDCPGHFACDLGICTDFSFVKGGSENLWTVDGLPRQIDVTMAIRDLYPVLSASKNSESLYFNIGLSTFLDNLAGVSIFRSDDGKGDLVTRTRQRLNSALGQARGITGIGVAATQRFLENYTPLPALFRLNSKDRG